MEYISGASREQMIMMPDCIDDYVGEENTVRVIDAYVNGLDMQMLGFSHPTPNDTGRPRYNPKDLLKLYIYGYMNRVRSSRRLEAETKRNLEVIWLLHKLTPDHKTIASFRHDNAAALKNVFRDFVKLCMKLGLYGKELIAIDGRFYKKTNGFGVFHNTEACRQCPCKCSKETYGRRYHVPMPESEFSKVYNDRDLTVKQIRIAPNKQLIRQRKSIVEHPFGTIKRSMDAGYCLTRGLQNVSGEFSLAFLAYNLKRVSNILGTKKLIEYMAAQSFRLFSSPFLCSTVFLPHPAPLMS